ncbi:phage tail assembly chaperone [Paraburkholderia domus]|uniref:Phage tail protein n=1 Tax=Paraburkholderia domus TaxID=2793075 RepID=A0A9N8QS30_9BURK|nr:phage tail assembly chaperone [Paraburkholderia domus]MBK5163938.1 phage tail assembly chaperone [Burkholderia sp. R-70211]CAE6856149.1 hypothetical protein R70211_00174 [Paraburkholderia domus]
MLDFKNYNHDLMVTALQGMLGDHLVHGKDFWIGHPITDGEQSGDPFILAWACKTVPQPSDEAVHAYFKANENTLRALRVRSFRDEALSNSDGRADTPSDAPASFKAKAAEWAEYRAALRDIPDQPGFPSSIEWPELPV